MATLTQEDLAEAERLATLAPRELTREYLLHRRIFRDAIKRAARVSRGSGGVWVETNRLAYASLLFTRITVLAKSISVLLPDCKPKEHWDFSSVASLTRNMAEAYLWYYWLCEDDVDEDLRQSRFVLMYCHDHGSRGKMLGEIIPPADDKIVMDDLVARFDANPYLRRFSDKARREALKGHKTPFVQDDVIERMGVDKVGWRFIYRLFSQHTHTSPVSFMRMIEHDRGTGVETAHEKQYIIIAMQFALGVLNGAIEGHCKLFPDAETRTPFLSDVDVIKAVERNQGRIRLRG
ncbi:DUF5677 domain-containing protein [Novosphingobium sp.]|uniref:DUF5677 domain-containing protein n=1 Tax=Novosphingobium sp. TaxID=1874826 RepID=UPI003BA9A721